MIRNKTQANINCGECGLQEPTCDNCGKNFLKSNTLIYCGGSCDNNFEGKKHYCSKCNKIQSKGE